MLFHFQEAELSGGVEEDVKMGVGPMSFHLLAVGVIRVRVASEAVEVTQLHLLFFGTNRCNIYVIYQTTSVSQ